MAMIILCRRVCESRKLLNSNLITKCKYTMNAIPNARKGAQILETKFPLFTIPKRNFFWPFKKPTIGQLHVKDGVPDEYMLIYRSRMDRYLLLAQLFSSVTAFIVIAFSIYSQDFSNLELDYSKWDIPARSTNNEVYVYIAVFIGLVVTMQVLVSRLPLRIYYLPQQKKYRFVFYGNYPFTQRQLSCKIGDVAPLPETGISPWKQARYYIKNEQKVILMDHYFRRPADLYIMLGVQRDHDVEKEK